MTSSLSIRACLLSAPCSPPFPPLQAQPLKLVGGLLKGSLGPGTNTSWSGHPGCSSLSPGWLVFCTWLLLCSKCPNPCWENLMRAGPWTHTSLAFLPLWPSNCGSWSLAPCWWLTSPCRVKTSLILTTCLYLGILCIFNWPSHTSPYWPSLLYVSCPQSDLQQLMRLLELTLRHPWPWYSAGTEFHWGLALPATSAASVLALSLAHPWGLGRSTSRLWNLPWERFQSYLIAVIWARSPDTVLWKDNLFLNC